MLRWLGGRGRGEARDSDSSNDSRRALLSFRLPRRLPTYHSTRLGTRLGLVEQKSEE